MKGVPWSAHAQKFVISNQASLPVSSAYLPGSHTAPPLPVGLETPFENIFLKVLIKSAKHLPPVSDMYTMAVSVSDICENTKLAR